MCDTEAVTAEEKVSQELTRVNANENDAAGPSTSNKDTNLNAKKSVTLDTAAAENNDAPVELGTEVVKNILFEVDNTTFLSKNCRSSEQIKKSINFIHNCKDEDKLSPVVSNDKPELVLDIQNLDIANPQDGHISGNLSFNLNNLNVLSGIVCSPVLMSSQPVRLDIDLNNSSSKDQPQNRIKLADVVTVAENLSPTKQENLVKSKAKTDIDNQPIERNIPRKTERKLLAIAYNVKDKTNLNIIGVHSKAKSGDKGAEDVKKPEKVVGKAEKPSVHDSITSVGSNICRICMTAGKERLIKPCNCKGSMGSVHLSCLERWLNQVGRNYCELCGYCYPSISTPRYTLFQSLRIWFSSPRNRVHFQSDCMIFWLLTTVTAGLLAVCIMGTHYFAVNSHTLKQPKHQGHNHQSSSVSYRVTETAMDFFMAVVLSGYSFTVYLLWKDHYVTWKRWRRANVNVRLLISENHQNV